MARMRAGKLRSRVTIQKRATVVPGMWSGVAPITQADTIAEQDDFGSVITAWDTYATRYAEIVTMRGAERIETDQEISQATHRVRMRFVDGLVPEMRIIYNGRTFEILHINDIDMLHHHMLVYCIEVQI